MIERRTMLAAAAAGGLATPALAAPSHTRRAPSGFLWGTAISAHQSEGNDVNSDVWLLENIKPTVFKQRSGDACDSYHRFAEDIALHAALGFNCYRFGIEWARIEPSEGQFSNAELDHYEKVLETCHAHKLTPVVTFNHFTTPRWFAEHGGFEVTDGAFARYCSRTAERLARLMGLCSTFNEANVQLLLKLIGPTMRSPAAQQAMMPEARRVTGMPKFSSVEYADPEVSSRSCWTPTAKASRRSRPRVRRCRSGSASPLRRSSRWAKALSPPRWSATSTAGGCRRRKTAPASWACRPTLAS